LILTCNRNKSLNFKVFKNLKWTAVQNLKILFCWLNSNVIEIILMA
jgi:hypothetical protein